VANVESWLSVQLPCAGYVSTADGPFPANLAFWCVMIRRAVWERVGPLDEGYFMYAEDEDWCVRARRLGYHLQDDYHDTGQLRRGDERASRQRRRPAGLDEQPPTWSAAGGRRHLRLYQAPSFATPSCHVAHPFTTLAPSGGLTIG
jgi:hypothetical protein